MSAKKNTNKSIFVSSTFRDMQAERDALRDFVLPRVNEFAAQYGRAVEIIDLRWGVDTASVSEAEQNHKVLRTCLDEIERSRPFFLGLIGDRYGWTPPRHDMEAALEAAQFSLDDLNKSVTALEIEYGALRSEDPPICLFYFRESPDYSGLPEELRRIYRDEAEGLEKLAKLKETIRARFKTDIKNYTAEVYEKGLSVSKDWADIVAQDIITKLREEWGESADTPPDWKEHERGIQETFRESRTAHFAGRTAAIADMAAFCLGGETKPQFLMLQGEAGSDKSGLLCRVMDEIEDQCLLLPFSCGISSRSSLVENMLHCFISLICKKMALEDDNESITKFQELKDRFTVLLFVACQKMRVVAVVDALDQFAGGDEARRMLWISGRLPENFRLLCSIIDGPETEAVKQLSGEIRSMPPIDTADEAAIIHGIAARHHKQIASAVVEHILKKQTPNGAQAAQNPLYLSLITQNLVMMDRYELDTVQQYMEGGMSQPEALAKFMRERIDEIPGDAEGAYLAILSRLENLIGQKFVRGVCGMIAVSRSGLRESDMEGAFRELGTEFNPADFAWLRQMLRGHVSQGDVQQWDFSHQSLRRALRKDRPEELKQLNDWIVGYFIKNMDVEQDDDFAAREIMHHLCAANRPDIAAEIIARYYYAQRYSLMRGLADVYTEHETGPAFLLAVPAGTENVEADNLWRITEIIRKCLPLLPENTRPFRIELMLASLAILDGQKDNEILQIKATGENTVANLYKETGDGGKAGEYYQKYLGTRERIFEHSGTRTTQTEISASGTKESVFEQSYTMDALGDLSVAWYKMGDHLRSLGRIEEAETYYQKSIDALERVYKDKHTVGSLRSLSMACERMGSHLRSLGRTEEAGEYYRKFLDAAERIYEQTGTVEALEDLMAAYERMSNHLRSLGRMEETREYYKKFLDAAERIYEQTGTIEALRDMSVSWYTMGDDLRSLGRNEEAGAYYQKSLDALKHVYEQRSTVKAMGDLSNIYRKMAYHLISLERKEEAGVYYQKLLDARERIYEQTGTVDALSRLSMAWFDMGNHLRSLGHTEEAGAYYQKSIDARERVYKQTGTVDALRDLAKVYNSMGDYLSSLERIEEAGEYYRKSFEIRERIYGQSRTAVALRDLVTSHDRMGDNKYALELYDEALAYRLKALELFEQHVKLDPSVQVHASRFRDKVISSYNDMGDRLTKLGQAKEAKKYYRKALDMKQ